MRFFRPVVFKHQRFTASWEFFSPMVSSESVETVPENETSMISPRDLCVPMLLLRSSVAIDPLLCVDDHVADVAKF